MRMHRSRAGWMYLCAGWRADPQSRGGLWRAGRWLRRGPGPLPTRRRSALAQGCGRGGRVVVLLPRGGRRVNALEVLGVLRVVLVLHRREHTLEPLLKRQRACSGVGFGLGLGRGWG